MCPVGLEPTTYGLREPVGRCLGLDLLASVESSHPEDFDVRCIQSATATYDEEGFSATAATAIDFIATRCRISTSALFDRSASPRAPNAVIASLMEAHGPDPLVPSVGKPGEGICR